MASTGWFVIVLAGVAAIVWGAETFAEHLAVASARLGVSAFALAILLAGAEPEELATAVAASLRHAPVIALGDVIGANVAMCLVAVGVGAVLAPLPFDARVRRYALAGLPAGGLAATLAWDGTVTRAEGLVLVAAYTVFIATIWMIERTPPALGEIGELAGGSNGYRVRAWKWHLAQLAADTGLEITVCHYPPGTSKWNKIEHRLFSFISMNWRGRPLTDIRTIVELIAATSTTSGLTVQAAYDPTWYATGVKITDQELGALALTAHGWHGEWNYTIAPSIPQ